MSGELSRRYKGPTSKSNLIPTWLDEINKPRRCKHCKTGWLDSRNICLRCGKKQ